MFDLDKGCQLLLGLTAATSIKFAAAWWLRQRHWDRFERVGTVSEIIVYPIKSCKGVPVQEAECTKFGMKVSGVTDRHWMVTRSEGRFLSQRIAPKMVFISTTIVGDSVQLDAPGMKSFLQQPPVTNKYQVKKCSVGVYPVEGIDCGNAIGEWVSDYLSMPGLRVVNFSQDLAKRNFINNKQLWGD